MTIRNTETQTPDETISSHQNATGAPESPARLASHPAARHRADSHSADSHSADSHSADSHFTPATEAYGEEESHRSESNRDEISSADSSTEGDEAPLATSFAELLDDEQLVEILRKQGIESPTEIQARAVPVLIDGKDAILQAQTGSGKTLAFALPLLAQFRKNRDNPAWSSLMITPTRELAIQIESVIRSIAPDSNPVCIIGGSDMQAQIRGLKQDSRIVIGTPGRILDLMRQKELRLKNCRFFAVDEVDELLSTGFLEDIRQILSRLPDKRQGVFVSATVTGRVEMLAHSFLSKPARIVASSEEPTLQHFYCEVGADLLAKTVALCDLVETLRPRSAIIFCNTKSDTQLVEALLRRRGFDARRINSDLTQKQRNRIMKLIRDQELQLLIATDVAARGIDIAQLDLVVNYSIHDQTETYVHRTGRTGRAGRSGRAISLVGPRDFGAFHHLTKVLPLHFEKITVPSDAEVADARLTHLYELLRAQEIELKERDVLVARQLLREQGGIEEPSENLEQLIGKLCRSAIEHSVGLEAKGLDEEEIPEELERRSAREDDRRRGGERDERRGRGGRQDDRRGGRDGEERREGRRGGERRDDRRERGGERNERRDRGYGDSRERAPEGEERAASASEGSHAEGDSPAREERSPRGDRRGGRDRRREDGRSGDAGEQRGRDGDLENRPPHRAMDERIAEQRSSEERGQGGEGSRFLRIYVGQGSRHGMTNEVFRSLAADMVELPPDSILATRFRDVYGFVDVTEQAAGPLIDSLNGIEYNGALLPVEVAMVKEPERRSYDRRGGGRRNDRGSQGRGGDYRGGGRGRRDRGGRDYRGNS